MCFILNFTHSREYSYWADRFERCANRTAFNVDFPHSLFEFTIAQLVISSFLAYLIAYLLTYLLTYLLIALNSVILEMLTGFQQVKKFLAYF